MSAEILPISNVITNITIANEELKMLTNRIASNTLSAAKNLLQVASDLKQIESKKLFKEDGFKSIIDYGAKVFGWKKDMIYNLLRVAKNYIDESGTATIFLKEHDRPTDYTVGQLQEFLNVPTEKILELDKEDAINPSMTTVELRKIVKPFKEVRTKNGKEKKTGKKKTTAKTENNDSTSEPLKNEESVETENCDMSYITSMLSEATEYVFKIKDIANGLDASESRDDIIEYTNNLEEILEKIMEEIG